MINGAAVKGINHLVEVYPKLLTGIKVFRLMYQYLRKVLIDTPILLLIYFCKCGLRHCFEPRPVLVLSAKVECCLNISKTGTVGKLSEAHHHELVTAVELEGVPATLVTVDTLPKLIFIDKRHDLRKDDIFAVILS